MSNITAAPDHSHLSRPGPQPFNSNIAPTYAEQYESVFRPRPARPYPRRSAERLAATMRAYPDLFDWLTAEEARSDSTPKGGD
jgi:hypothetical protein